MTVESARQKAIAARLRERRERSGLSQEQIAAKAGLSRQTVANLESAGAGRVESLTALEDALDKALEDSGWKDRRKGGGA